ncbi:MAG: hypothetical protein V9E98_04890 [Candidatus Nanopelagicales bacterium]
MMAWLFAEVPGWVRLLLTVAITVAITVVIVWRFHDRILALSNGDPWPPEPQETAEESDGKADKETDDDKDDDDSGKPPKPFYLAGRIMAITTTAFVFLLAFTLNNFWGNAQDARVALEEEGGYYQSAVLAAAGLPDGPHKDAVLEALRGYGTAVVEQEWPLLEQANSVEALNLHRRLGAELARVTVLADPPAEVTNDPSWGAITTAIPDILDQGTQRIHQLPRPQAPGIIGLIFLLAILNLAVTAAYQPAPLVQNMVLMGLMAGIVALMLFILVETSNPFAGSGAVLPTPFLR